MSWNIIEKKTSGHEGNRTCVAGISNQQTCFMLETIMHCEQCQGEGVCCVALLPYPQKSLSEGAQYISSVFESQVYAYSANMSFAITVKSVNNSQQKRDFLNNLYKNFNIKIIEVFAN